MKGQNNNPNNDVDMILGLKGMWSSGPTAHIFQMKIIKLR
jgi:hypothetical protein